MDYQNFKASTKRLVETLAPDIGFILQNEAGFDELKEELMYLAISNCLLIDYEGTCPPFESLSSKLPLPYLLSTETGLCKKMEPHEVDKVSSSDKNSLFGEAKFYLEDFTLIVSSVNSINDQIGLKRLNKCLCLVNYIDHPKDFVFLSAYFMQFFEKYFRANLFPQTLNLLSSTTDQECMLEVTKAFCYLYNALKFKNHVFNFKALLDKEKVSHQLLGREMVRDIASLASRTDGQVQQACLIMLVNIVK